MYVLTCKSCKNNILKMQKEFFETYGITTFRILVESNQLNCCEEPNYSYGFVDKIIESGDFDIKRVISKEDLESFEKDITKKQEKEIKILRKKLLKINEISS